MNHITYRISLDMRKTESGVVVRVKRDDTVKKLAISLTDGGKPYHITEDCRAVFAGEKPDGTILCNPCSIEDCVVTYEITPQTIADLGEVESEIRLYSTAGDLATSPSFTILVVPSVYDDDRVIESHDEVNELTELITSAAGTIQKGEKVVQQGNAIFAGLRDKEDELGQYVEILSQVPTKYVSLEAQETSDAQKVQARTNIGAAPGGYGWGETNAASIPDGDANKARATGLYSASSNTKNAPTFCNLVFVQARTSTAIYQIAYCTDGNIYMRSDDHDCWSEWELINGSGQSKCVLYTQQDLTEAQKEQARDNIGAISANEIPLSKEKVYEHIATITVTPDTDGNLPQYVIFSADSDGNPFELTDFIVQARAGFADGNKSGLYMTVNNNKLVIGNSTVSGISTTPRSFTIFCRLENDGSVRVEHTVSGSSTSFYNPANAINESRVIAPAVMTGYAVATITKINLYTLTGDTKAWVEGSTFELWGVRV